MNALVNPTNRTGGGNRWGLLAHTVAMFTNATISLAIGLYVLPGSYINGREFPGGDGLPPGPYGYSLLPQFATTAIVANSVVQVNQWLADGLLVSSLLSSISKVFNLGCSYSCIVVTSFTA